MAFGQDAGAGLDLEEAVGGVGGSAVTPGPEGGGDGHEVPLAEQRMRAKWFHAVDSYNTRYGGANKLAKN